MKENATALYPDQEIGEVVSNYSYEHSTNLPPYLIEMHGEIKDREDSFYMISPLQQQFHIWFAKSVGAKRSKLHICGANCRDSGHGMARRSGSTTVFDAVFCGLVPWLSKQHSNEVFSRVIVHLSS